MEDIRTKSIDLLENMFEIEMFLPGEGEEYTFDDVFKRCTELFTDWLKNGTDPDVYPPECLRYLLDHPDEVAEVIRNNEDMWRD